MFRGDDVPLEFVSRHPSLFLACRTTYLWLRGGYLAYTKPSIQTPIVSFLRVRLSLLRRLVGMQGLEGKIFEMLTVYRKPQSEPKRKEQKQQYYYQTIQPRQHGKGWT